MVKKIEVKVRGMQESLFYRFTNKNNNLKTGDYVIIETKRGQELAQVQSISEKGKEELKPIIRIAIPNDLEVEKQNQKQETEIISKTNIFVKELKLNMNIVDCVLMHNKKKVVVYFTSNHRVDFRELVKKMAFVFKMKIELRQINQREEFSLEKSVGPCGRVCCCANNKNLCKKNNIKMAKIQGVSLTGNNVNGVCDKLKCCIAYEYKMYEEELKTLPQINVKVETPDGKGKVVFLEVLSHIIHVQFEDGTRKKYKLAEIKRFNNDK